MPDVRRRVTIDVDPLNVFRVGSFGWSASSVAIVPTSGPGIESLVGRKAEDEYHQREDGEPQTPGIERNVFVDGARVMRPEDEQHDDGDDRPAARRARRTSARQRRHGSERDKRASSSEHGVRNVAAVELPDGKQVERGGEHPEPRCEGHRMHVDRVAVRWRSPAQPRDGLKQQRFAKLHEVRAGRQRRHSGEAHTEQQQRNSDHEAGDRPGNADVEELALARNRLTDANERAEGAEQQLGRRRQEIGKRGVDAVVPARVIVAELVRAEDGQRGCAVPQAVEQTADVDRSSVRVPKSL